MSGLFLVGVSKWTGVVGAIGKQQVIPCFR